MKNTIVSVPPVILGLAGIDQGIPSAPRMREWIKKHGHKNLNR